MKLTCGIVQDLLEMYEAGMCGEESRLAVEAHLAECQTCRSRLGALRRISTSDIPENTYMESETVIRGFRKIRRRWIRSLIAMLLTGPLLILSVNQFRQAGVCFTNPDEIILAYRYVRAIETGNFEKAASYMDYDSIYGQIQDALSWEVEDYLPMPEDEARRHYEYNQKLYADARDMSAKEFESFMKSYYASELRGLADQGVTFRCTGYKESYYLKENDAWQVEFGMEAIADGNSHLFSICIGIWKDKVSIVSMRYVEDLKWNDAIANALNMHWPWQT